ncbi:hypothetical protein Vqi01_32540 [Micromonospora qiuiae]|uniref:Secreted protein n=1 Tax=Micromonospora qiuiae TaxID=502268 RepID=A0ABQ4JD64_9ACTN|nr:hypothetical protein Vqi01_32540 [Micromonospora qiuiae]
MVLTALAASWCPRARVLLCGQRRERASIRAPFNYAAPPPTTTTSTVSPGRVSVACAVVSGMSAYPFHL